MKVNRNSIILPFIFFSYSFVLSFTSYWSWKQNGTFIYGHLPIPRMNRNQAEIQSACSNGQLSKTYGFSCPHMLMFSEDMILASHYDNHFNHFYYAVAGGYSDDECGKCYQVQLLEAENKERLPKKQMILQVINSGFDVERHQWDILMAGGGFGYYTSCNEDCDSMYCLGGPCHDFLYHSFFNDWAKLKSKSLPNCYSGTNYNVDLSNHTEIYQLCFHLVKETHRPMDNMTIDSCYRSYLQNYHQNFLKTASIRVQCPEGLYRLTGLRRQDDLQFPLPAIQNELTTLCEGNIKENRYCITTMQDCCKPSCAWNYKGDPSQIWPRVDTCDRDGYIYNYVP